MNIEASEMVAHDTEKRREKSSQRRMETPAIFPLIDSNGEPVLWDRRKLAGRRKSDRKPLWSRKDLPGFVLMGILFISLVVAVWYLL